MPTNSKLIDDEYLPTGAVCRRYKVCDRTIDRWTADERVGFPKPLIINNRRYWALAGLQEFERTQIGGRLTMPEVGATR